MDNPTNGTILKEVFNEKKCPAMTKKIAQTLIKSNPQILLDACSTLLRSVSSCCASVINLFCIYQPIAYKFTEFGHYIFKNKKAWEPVPVARLTLWGLRIALFVETSNADPTPICIYKSYSHTIYCICNIVWLMDIWHTPWHLPLLCFWRTIWSLRSSKESKPKRQVNAFSIMSSPPYSIILKEESGYRHENNAKLNKNHYQLFTIANIFFKATNK